MPRVLDQNRSTRSRVVRSNIPPRVPPSIIPVNGTLGQEVQTSLCEDGGMTNDGTDIDGLTIGILGGTGDQGRGLAFRFARAGLRVVIGSRSVDRAVVAAAELSALVPAGDVT